MSVVHELDRTDWLQTHTGKKIYPYIPRAEDVDVRDIVHALANICRFGGHARSFYSVAQHSVYVSHFCEPENALIGLFHDSVETYLGDVVRPLKRGLADYSALEKQWALVIGEELGFGDTLANLPHDVKRADMKLLVTEKRDVVARGPGWNKIEPGYEPVEPIQKRIKPFLPTDARTLFCKRLRQLAPDLAALVKRS